MGAKLQVFPFRSLILYMFCKLYGVSILFLSKLTKSKYYQRQYTFDNEENVWNSLTYGKTDITYWSINFLHMLGKLHTVFPWSTQNGLDLNIIKWNANLIMRKLSRIHCRIGGLIIGIQVSFFCIFSGKLHAVSIWLCQNWLDLNIIKCNADLIMR